MAATGIAAIASYVSAAGAAGTFAISATAWAAVAIAAAATYASQTMARRQQQQAERQAKTQGPSLASFRSAIAPRQSIYGRCRTGGPLAYLASISNNNALLMDVMLAGHECTAIDEVWLDEYHPTLEQKVMGFWGAYEILVPMTGTDGEGNTYTYIGPETVGGMTTPVWVEASQGRYRVRQDLIVLFGCELEHLGQDGQTASQLLMTNSPGGQWTSEHRLDGICHVPIKFSWAPDAFPNGPPNMTFVVRGKKLYDPRDGTHDLDDSSTWAYSNNPALCILDYLINNPLGLNASSSEIDWTSFETAADACDVSTSKADGTTEARYTCNGVLSTADTHENNLVSLLTSCDGKLVYSGGKFRLYAGAWTASVATFTEDDLRGPITIQTQQARSSVYNEVRGTFSDPESNWQPTDYPAVISSTYRTLDQGEVLSMDLPLPMTTSASMAQRLAKIALERSRRQMVVQMPAKLTALNVLPGETIALTFPRYGWTAQTFVVDELKLVTEDDENGQPRFGVDLVLRQHDENVFAWTSNEEQQLPAAPTTNLPNPFVVASPQSVSISETLVEVRATVQSVVRITWEIAQDTFVRWYRPRYKLHADTEWTMLADTAALYTEISLPPGDYDFGVAGVNNLGNVSDFIQTRATVYGLSEAPSALDDLTIQTAGGLAILTWTQSADLDVRVGGRIEIRHAPVTSGATWSTATPIGSTYPGSAALAVLPLKTGTYLVRPYDAIDTPGTVSSVSTDGATALTFSSLSTLTEDPTFGGSKTSTVVSSSKLQLDALGNWDSVTDVDAIVDVDGLGGIATEGSYAFATTMDLGSSKRVRLSSSMTATVVAVLDRVDSRSLEIDSWATFDGTDGDEAAAWVEVQDSADNVTYSSWRRLDASEAVNRYFKFRAQLRSYNADYNIQISALSVNAAEVV